MCVVVRCDAGCNVATMWGVWGSSRRCRGGCGDCGDLGQLTHARRGSTGTANATRMHGMAACDSINSMRLLPTQTSRRTCAKRGHGVPPGVADLGDGSTVQGRGRSPRKLELVIKRLWEGQQADQHARQLQVRPQNEARASRAMECNHVQIGPCRHELQLPPKGHQIAEAAASRHYAVPCRQDYIAIDAHARPDGVAIPVLEAAHAPKCVLHPLIGQLHRHAHRQSHCHCTWRGAGSRACGKTKAGVEHAGGRLVERRVC